MSTLEQIRQRPILIITILGLALALFIFTAVDRPGELFSDSHTVAKVDGEKIDYMDFQRRVEQQQQQMQERGYTNVDIAQIQEYVLQQMVAETLLNKEFKRLGLVVTDTELSKAMLGDTPSPYVTQMVQQMGAPDAKTLYDAAFDPASGADPQQAQQFQNAWRELENNTEKILLQQKFMSLFMGTITANRLDAKAMFDDNASTATIAYAKKDLNTLADDDFPVTDDEINALYKTERNRYRIVEPQHLVSYITVDITPSADDLQLAQRDVEDAIVGLRTTEGTEAVSSNTKFYVNRVQGTESSLAPVLRKATAMAVDSAAVLQFVDNQYTIAKVLDVTTAIDSVLVDLAFIDQSVDADSIISRLNTGAKAIDLGQAIAGSQDSIWVSLLDPSLGMLKDEIANAAPGSYFTPENGQKGMALKVRTRRAPVKVYDIAEITYDVIPSNTTINRLNESLRKFLSENPTADAFKEKATEVGYSALSAVVTPSTLSINGLSDSRGAAKWALDAKKGQVSGIFNNDHDSRLLAVAVNDIYKGDFVPATNESVRTYLTNKVRNTKKAEKIIADLSGKSTPAAAAEALNVRVDTTQVTFGQPFVRGIGMNEAALLANVAVAKKGQNVGPLALNNSVVVLTVTDINNQGREFDFTNDAIVFNQREGASSFQRSLPDVMLGKKKITNKIQKFYSDRQ